MRDELVIKLTEPVGDPCMTCGGFGRFMDGAATFGAKEIRIKPATKCLTCGGTGRVEYITKREHLAEMEKLRQSLTSSEKTSAPVADKSP